MKILGGFFYSTLIIWCLSMLGIAVCSIAELFVEKDLVLPCICFMLGCMVVFFIEGIIYLLSLFISSLELGRCKK